jgi:TPR repeat protein
MLLPLVLALIAIMSACAQEDHMSKKLEELISFAEGGHSEAQTILATLYYQGEFVEQDYAEAVRWYRAAVEQGNVTAHRHLGMMYYVGDGVPQDQAEGVRLLRVGAEHGDPFAQVAVGLAHSQGRGVPQDDVEAAHWYRAAAEQGDAEGQFLLGYVYEDGLGVPQDGIEAIRWYYASAKQSNERAVASLANTMQNFPAYTVAKPAVNLRSGPSTDSQVLGTLRQGTIAYYLADTSHGWFEVYVPDATLLGFVSAELLTQ